LDLIPNPAKMLPIPKAVTNPVEVLTEAGLAVVQVGAVVTGAILPE
jgi:hypothetical protein